MMQRSLDPLYETLFVIQSAKITNIRLYMTHTIALETPADFKSPEYSELSKFPQHTHMI